MPSQTTRLQSLLEAVPDALIGMDQKGMIRFVNRQTEALFGYDRDQLIGRHIDTLVSETLYAVYAQHREDYFADPRTRSSGLDLELTARMRDGKDLSVNISMSSIDTGDVLLVITARRDVTTQRRAVEGAQLTAAIVEFSDDAIIGSTLEGVVTSWNPAAERMYGYPSGKIIGKYAGRLSPQDRADELDAALARVKAGQHTEHLETERVRRDGTVFRASIKMAPIRDENGAIVGVSVICRDVTELRHAARYTWGLIEVGLDSLMTISPQGRIDDVNEAAVTITGVPRDRLIGSDFTQYVTEPDKASESFHEAFAKESVTDVALTVRHQDGTLAEMRCNFSVYRDISGNALGVLATAHDVTAQMKASEMAQRMAAIVESSGDAIVSLTLDGVITHWNTAAEDLYGYSSSEAIGRSFGYMLPGDRHGELNDVLSWVKDGQVIQDCLYSELPRKDGTLVPISITIAPLRDSRGEVVGVVTTSHDATEQRCGLDAAQRLAAIVEGSGDAIFGSTPERIITSWNRGAEALFGYSSEEIVGRSASLLIPQDQSRAIDEVGARVLAGNHVARFEMTTAHKDGAVLQVSLTVSPIFGPDGSVIGASTICHDVTEQRQAFEAAQRLAAIVESSQDAIVGRRLDGTITSWNPAAERMFGYSSAEMIGGPATCLIPADRADEVAAALARIKSGHLVERLETRRVRKDGTVFPVSITVSPIRDENGAPVGASLVLRDLTERDHAARYARSLVEAAMDPLMMIGLDGSINDLNEAAVKVIGLSRDELIGSDFTQYVTEPDKAGDILQRLLAQGWVINAPLTMRHRNGTLTRVLCNASAYRDSAGNVLGMLAIARDVTEHLLKDEAVQELASMVDFLDEAIIGTTLDGIVTSWNPAATRMHGYSADEVVGRSIGLVIPDDRADEVAAILARVNAGQVVRGLETVRMRKDGTVFPVSITVGPIRDSGGAIVGSTALGHELD